MLNKKELKRCLCFVHYFSSYALVGAYVFFICSCVGRGLMPKLIKILPALPEKVQEKYIELIFKLPNDKEKEKLEKEVKKFNSSGEAEKFIEKKYQKYQMCKTHSDLFKLLLKSERAALEQKFDKAVDPDEQVKVIDHYSNKLQMIKNLPMLDRQAYIDLLEVLPEDQAIAFATNIQKCTNQNEVSQMIESKLPNEIKKLNQDDKERFFLKLPDYEQHKILRSIIHAGAITEKTSVDPTAPPPSYEGVSGLPSYAQLDIKDINKFIEEKAQQQEEKDEEEPQDGWRTKLPLVGEKRRKFLISIIQFPQSDQKYLKELFDKADPDSIENFFSVFFTGFSKDEGIKLLSLMVCLYTKDKSLTLKMCNQPHALSTFDRMKIAGIVGFNTRPLEKLNDLLS